MRLTVIATALAFVGASAGHSEARSNFFLRVGPGVNATVLTPSMHLSCSDDANCKFEVPPNSTFDIVASAGGGHQFQWAGCTVQPDGDRCRVHVREDAVRITVR